MNSLKSLAAFAFVGLASFALTPSAVADTWNKKTIMTINEPLQVPGALLQPGKYVMKLLDSQSNRHIVQIFNADETHLETTILAIPNYRLQPTGKTEFQFWETPASQPKAMRAWFYPGDNFGQEFAYPKNTAVQIASYSSSNQSVPAVSQTENLEQATVSAVDKAGTESELNKETYTKAETAPAPEVAQNRTPEPAPQAAAPEPAPAPAPVVMAENRARTELPKTASPFPMYGLAGFLALGTSVALRAIAKRAA